MEIEFKKSYMNIIAANGGQVSLNCLMKILKRAFLGPDRSGKVSFGLATQSDEETVEEQPGRTEPTLQPGPHHAMTS